MKKRGAFSAVRSPLCVMTLLLAGVTAVKAQVVRSAVASIRARHVLTCGVVQEDAEYSTEEDHSSRGGFDEALCQAYAVAVDARANVKVTSFLDEVSAVKALRAGQVNVVPTLSVDALHRAKGVRYAQPIFYDSLALLVPLSSGIGVAQGLAGKKICVLAETGAEEELRDWFAGHKMDYLPFPFQEEGEMEAAYATGNCSALAAERTRLALVRAAMGTEGQLILPEKLSQDAMASGVRGGDVRWAAVVGAVDEALMLAEEMGANSPEFRSRTATLAKALGLRAGWAMDVVRAVGSYGEMYERTLGGKFPRDVNRLGRDGGLLSVTSRTKP